MLLCKDCQWVIADGDAQDPYAYAKCNRPNYSRRVTAEDLVSGPRSHVSDRTHCSSERMDWWPFYYLSGECGHRGRFWMPKINGP
jgi:hypothetical protein